MVWNIEFMASNREDFAGMNKYENKDKDRVGIIETDMCSDGKMEMELSGLLLGWMADYSSSPFTEDEVIIMFVHEFVESSIALFVMRLLRYVPHALHSVVHYMAIKGLNESHHPNVLPW